MERTISSDVLEEELRKISELYENAQSTEEVLDAVERYKSLGDKIWADNLDDFKAYYGFYDKIGNRTYSGDTRFSYNGMPLCRYDVFDRVLKEAPKDYKLVQNDILSTLLADEKYKSRASLELNLGFKVNEIESLTPSQSKRVDNILNKCKRYAFTGWERQLVLLKDLTNAEGLSKSARKIVNSVASPESLKAKFQTPETFDKLVANGYYSLMCETLGCWINGKDAETKYYQYFESGSGRMPETKTGLFDAYIAKAFKNDASAMDNKNVKKARNTFAFQDILQGNGDKLKAEDIVSLLATDKTFIHSDKLFKKIGVKKAEEVFRADAENNELSTAQKLMIVNMQLANNPNREDALRLIGYAKNYSNRDGVSAKLVAEVIKNVEALKAKVEESSSYREDKKAIEKYDETNKRLEEMLADVYKADRRVTLVSKLYDAYAKMEGCIKTCNVEGYPSLSKEAVVEKIKEYMKTNDRTVLHFSAPQEKIPLLFGRKDALENQQVLNNVVNSFNSAMADIAISYKADNMKELLGADVEKVLDKETLDAVREQYNALVVERTSLKNGNVEPQRANVNFVEACESSLIKMSECQKSKEQKQKDALARLDRAKEKVKDVKDPTAKIKVDEGLNPIAKKIKLKEKKEAVAEEKKRVALRRYEARKNVVRC